MNDAAASPGSDSDKDTTPNALDERVTRALALTEAADRAASDPPRTPPDARPTRAGRDGVARTMSSLAFLVALGAAALGVWNYLYPNVAPPDLSAVQAALGTAGAALRDAQSSMSGLDAELADMRTRVDELAAAQAAASRDVETVRNQTLETVDAMQRLATGEAFTGNRWIRAEAEHLMQSANIALQLNHDAATALAALEAADERLAQLADPALTPARAKLADEIAALRALPQPDLAGVALTLGSLAARVEMLAVVAPEQAAAAPTEAQSGWDRALARVSAAFKSMVSVQKTNGGGTPALAPEERFFLYRNLELELESARLAALRGDAANYEQSLKSARRWLETRFAQDDAGVQSALSALTELAGVELVTSWPDISGSLDELRRAESR